LSYHRRIAPGRHAILAPNYDPITYTALWHSAAAVRHELRSLGIGQADRVAVVLPNGPETVVATLAVASAAVCAPLNPSFAADEWHRYFGDLQVAALLTRRDMQSASRGVAHALGIPVFDLLPRRDEGPAAFGLQASGPRRGIADDLPPTGGDDAFLLLTSGTTSRPKTVPLTHASVCLSAHNAGAVLALGPGDRLLNVLPLYHAHGLISGVLAGLAAGSTVVSTSGFDADAFYRWLSDFRPTWYTAVPTMHRALLAVADRHKSSIRRHSLRLIRSASAALPAAELGELESLFGVPVIETYGMTEAASQIAANPQQRRKPGSVGLPAGAEIIIIDGEGNRLTAGETGEIALRGPTITRGYDNDGAATAAAFRDGWFRTGDLGYLDRDGYLFIVGRSKDVIKPGGQQVSPTEVEAVLLEHPSVIEAVAFSIPHARLGEAVAAAVVLCRGANIDVQNLRNFARERLADYKVPGLIRIVPQIAKSPAGKVQRDEIATALSMTLPKNRQDHADRFLPGGSDVEWQLAEIWAELLQLDQVGIEQDVFALGADSLTVTQVLSRLRERFGADLSYSDIFDAPTIGSLAARLAGSAGNSMTAALSLGNVPAAARHTPLSFQQRRIHLLSSLDPARYNYQIVEVARLSGSLNIACLEASIASICSRHEVLRSTFTERLGEPAQTLTAAGPRFERPRLQPCPKSRRAAVIRQRARQAQRRLLHIESEPSLRIELLRFAEDDHVLIVTLHHLITDGWSQRLFWEELEAHYAAHLRARPSELPEPCIQYRNYVAWQRAWLQTPTAAKQLSYWRRQLGGVSELPLRTDRPRPEMWTGRGARYRFKLARRLSSGIRALSRAKGVTLFMTLLAAFKCVLFRYTEHADVAIGSLIANRNQIQLERLIGMFANTLVLRTDLSGNPTFSEVLGRVRQVTLDAYRNQDLPLEEVLQVCQVPRSLDRNALFQVMFVLQNAVARAPTLADLRVHFVDVDPGIARFDLTLELMDADECMSGWFEYNTDLFEAATIARMSTHLRALLEAIVSDPDERISRLPLMSAGERRRVLFEWNDTQIRFSRADTFCNRFASQVERAPEAPAVSMAGACCSYRELAGRSAAIASRLACLGVVPNAIVALLAERDVNLLAAMLAVQQVGGAFLALDPTLPAPRLAHVLQASGARLLLVAQGHAATADKALVGIGAERRPVVLPLEDVGRVVLAIPPGLLRPAASDLAYVVYTSGSTGVPKGAMIERRGLFNHLLSQIADLELTASDVIAQTAPQSFVISVWQFLAPLMVGARVHICANQITRDPESLVQEIEREGVTILQIVPALLRAILEQTSNAPAFYALRRLRCLICTGEPLPADLCREWFQHFPDVPLMNAYGSAECSDDVATHRLTAPPTSTVPIGRAIANTQLYVLDADLAPVPIGVVGELYVGGVAVGRGYLNDPEQTRRRFLRDPFSKDRKGRLYRTGDLARWRVDGLLECLGRVDQQVKMRGYRIEPGEIEHILLEHADIRAVSVLVRHESGGEARLVAYVVAAPERQPTANELRDFLRRRVPIYMLPQGFVFLSHMPLTAHGKLDRSALAEMRQGLSVAGTEFVAPRNATEKILSKIWTDLLKIDNVGALSNFFDLGGHSLLAGQVLARVARECGVALPIQALFEAPTLEALARRIEDAGDVQWDESAFEIACPAGDRPQPISIPQERVMRIERELPGLPQFNLPFAYRLQGPLNVEALQRSLGEIMRRHDLLRTGFAWADERPFALTVPASEVDFTLTVEDLTAETLPQKERTRALLLKKVQLQTEQQAWTPFDLARAPLYRTHLFRLGPHDHVWLLILHHIIVDGWSIGLLFEELSKLYCAFAADQQAPLPRPELTFSDFARWQRRWCTSHAATRQLAYWKDDLRGASPLFARRDDQRNSVLSSRVAHQPLHLPQDLVVRLGQWARNQGATLFMTLLTGFKAMLLAQTGRTDICVATAMANRSHQRTEHLIGPLENTTLIRSQLHQDLSFREALGRVRAKVLAAHANQELPFSMLANRLAQDGDVDPASLIRAFFVMQNTSRRPLRLPDVAVRSFGTVYREGQPVLPIDHTWLTVMLKERASGMTGSCGYKEDFFTASTIQSWLVDYQKILAQAAANPETSLGRLVGR
jgi:amino acid adenylation domain-containing protein